MADPNDGWEEREPSRSRDRPEREESSAASSAAEPRYGLRVRPPPPPVPARAARVPRARVERSDEVRGLVDGERGASTLAQALDMAIRVAPELTLNSAPVGGRSLQNTISRLLAQFNNPHAITDLNRLAEQYKINALALFFLNKEDRRGNKSRRLANDIEEVEWRLRGLVRSLDMMKDFPPARWGRASSFVPVELQLPVVATDCNGETFSPISHDTFVQGRTIKLSDGYCYSFEDIIDLYNSSPDKNNIQSPMTRGVFTAEDIQIILTLMHQSRGGKSKKSKKSNKKTRSRH